MHSRHQTVLMRPGQVIDGKPGHPKAHCPRGSRSLVLSKWWTGRNLPAMMAAAAKGLPIVAFRAAKAFEFFPREVARGANGDNARPPHLLEHLPWVVCRYEDSRVSGEGFA
jgi:hypothetical protein